MAANTLWCDDSVSDKFCIAFNWTGCGRRSYRLEAPERVVVEVGDLKQPRLGLAPERWEYLPGPPPLGSV